MNEVKIRIRVAFTIVCILVAVLMAFANSSDIHIVQTVRGPMYISGDR